MMILIALYAAYFLVMAGTATAVGALSRRQERHNKKP